MTMSAFLALLFMGKVEGGVAGGLGGFARRLPALHPRTLPPPSSPETAGPGW
jgi:hypothetical protein